MEVSQLVPPPNLPNLIFFFLKGVDVHVKVFGAFYAIFGWNN